MYVVVWLYCDVFFFHDAATTEIYTYEHTLSLHDSLPICDGDGRRPPPRARDRQCHRQCAELLPRRRPRLHRRDASRRRGAYSRRRRRPRHPGRSEEHTSELQSLMRSSYAVFCLKKKTNISVLLSMNRNTTHKNISH